MWVASFESLLNPLAVLKIFAPHLSYNYRSFTVVRLCTVNGVVQVQFVWRLCSAMKFNKSFKLFSFWFGCNYSFCFFIRCEGGFAKLTTCLWGSNLLTESNWNNFARQVHLLPFGKMQCWGMWFTKSVWY